MRIYEEQNPYQSYQGGGGFNPVQEPDVAGAMERELRAGERRDQLYYDSLAQNDRQRVANAEQAASQQIEAIDANLKVLGKFSSTISGIVDNRIKQGIEKGLEDAAMKAWNDPLYADEETKKYDVEEAKIEDGQKIMNDAATKYEASGGSPIVGEGLRVGLTGRNRVAYERARMERLSLEFPSFYAQRLSQINNTQDPNQRAANEQAVVQEFLRRTGAIGTTPGMLNKYLMTNMRKVTAKAQLAWTTDTEKSILAGRVDEAQSELWTGMTSGNIGSSAGNFLETMQSLGKSPLEAKQELFKFLESNESTLSREDVNALRDTPITGHPAGKTFGKAFARELDALDGKVADNQDKMVQRRAEERKADQANVENIFAEESAKRRAAGNPYSAAELEEQRKIIEGKGLDASFLDDEETAESIPIATGKRYLESQFQKQGFITENDLAKVPAALRQDREIRGMLQTSNILSGQTKDQKDAVETSVKRLANTIGGVQSGFDVKGVEYDRVERGIRKDLNAQYMANLRSTKYRNEDGSLNYDQALSDAVDSVQAKAKTPTNPTGKDYSEGSSEVQRATRGNSRYEQRVQVYKGEMNKDAAFPLNNLFSSNDELTQAQEALVGKGQYPAIYQDLAAGQVNVTPYDIAMAQLQKAGRKIEPEPVEEAVRSQDPGIQRLLNYKPNANKTERAFTPNYNSPEVLSRNLKLSLLNEVH